MVIESEIGSKNQQDAMEESLYRVSTNGCMLEEQIRIRSDQNDDVQQSTQDLTNDIDSFIAGVTEMKEEQQRILAKIDKMKKMVTCQQQKVDEIKEWAEVVIDKSNRKAVYKTIKEKHRYLDIIKSKNNQLEIYLCELGNEEESLKREKENIEIRVNSASKSRSKKIIGNTESRSIIKTKRK